MKSPLSSFGFLRMLLSVNRNGGQWPTCKRLHNLRAGAAVWVVASVLASMTGNLMGAVELTVDQFQRTVGLVNWTNSLPFKKFDEGLGTLKMVRVTITDVLAVGSAQIENLDPNAPVTLSVTLGASVTVRRPDNSVFIGATAQASLSRDLRAYDGVTDSGGDSGFFAQGLASHASQSGLSVPPSSDLTLFAGPGSIHLPVEGVGVFEVSGGVNLATIFRVTASVEVHVEYIYEPRNSFVSGFVWNDLNGSGAVDLGESGIEGALVTLLDETGVLVAGVLPQPPTGPEGTYKFQDVPAGKYRVHVDAASIFVPTYDLDGTNTASEASITVVLGQDNLNVDFGYTVPVSTNSGSIGDRVWYDNDGDSLQGPGEPGIAGVTVVLRDESYVDVDLATQVTDENGFYIFTNLPSATYTVVVMNPVAAGTPTTWFWVGEGMIQNEAEVLLGSGENRLDVDFGYQRFDASIGNFVWNDRDRDGVQDPGELGIPGVMVYLYLAADPLNAVASMTTDDNGYYTFDKLYPGTYLVKADMPGGYVPTYDLDGLGTPNCAQVVLGAGQARTDVDFGYDRASLGDRVWNDANGNGVQDGGEFGIPGAVVELFTGMISLGTTTSDANGFYTFGDLEPGTYRVVVTVSASGFVPTYDLDGTNSLNEAAVSLAIGEDRMDVDFGYRVIDVGGGGGGVGGNPGNTAGLGDRVWSDVNGNGIQDGGEPGLAGVTLQVVNGLNNLVGTAVTDVNGHYMFTDLPAGTYTVSAEQPAGYIPTFDLDGLSAPAPNSALVTLVVGVTRTDVDFGYQQLGSIGDLVWNDLNGNGTPEQGEPGLAGVKVAASGPGGTYTAVTAANGQYSLPGVVPGTYTVTAEGPLGFEATYDFDGTNSPSVAVIVLTAGDARTEADFGYRATQNEGPQGRIGDLVWVDRNGNGVQDRGEPGLTNVTVILEDPSVGNTQSTVTDATGHYLFKNLSASTYRVIVTPPAGHIPVYDLDGVSASPDMVMVELKTGDHNLDVDFGYQELPGSIGDMVWLDSNANGVKDGAEPGLGGITVTLLDGLIELTNTVTATDGSYHFSNVLSGTYTVSATTPLNHAAVYDQDGGSPPGSTVVVMGINENRSDIDFGYQSVIGSIGDLVWNDANSNGVQDNGESGLSGVTVELHQGASLPVTRVTDMKGAYGFSNLLAGSYTVTVLSPAYHVPTFDVDGTGSPGVASVILDAGQNRTDVDFGYKYVPPVGSVGDRVWQDLNANGGQNAGEPGLVGVTVMLSQGSATLATTVTGTDGYYVFSNLLVGNYVVSVVPPQYYLETYHVVETIPLDGLGTSNRSTFALAAAENRRDIDFGYLYSPPPGSIGDRIWEDADGNSKINDLEKGLVGVTVVLYNGSNIPQATNTTSAGGYYTFSGLAAGVYTVRVTPPADFYNPTFDFDGIATANQATLTLGIGEDRTDVDFGYIYSPVLSSVGDRVWIDEDADGIQDLDELGLASATVTLRDGANQVLATAITDANGKYSFGNLWPGTYSIAVTVPANFTATFDWDGVFTPGVATVGLGFATDLTNIDFGYRVRTDLASIGDRLWNDSNWNAAQDPSETGLAGISVTLKDSANAIVATTKTGANGIYAFNNLLSGTYTVLVQRNRPAEPSYAEGGRGGRMAG